MLTALEIKAAYMALKTASMSLHDAMRAETEARHQLELAQAEALLSGAIDGKNAEIREAQLAQRMAPQADALRTCTEDVALRRLQLTVAQQDVDRIKTLLKLLTLPPEITGTDGPRYVRLEP